MCPHTCQAQTSSQAVLQVRVRRSGSGADTPGSVRSVRSEYAAANSVFSSAPTSAFVTPDASPRKEPTSRAGSAQLAAERQPAASNLQPEPAVQPVSGLQSAAKEQAARQHQPSWAAEPLEDVEAGSAAYQSVHGGSTLQRMRAERQAGLSRPAVAQMPPSGDGPACALASACLLQCLSTCKGITRQISITQPVVLSAGLAQHPELPAQLPASPAGARSPATPTSEPSQQPAGAPGSPIMFANQTYSPEHSSASLSAPGPPAALLQPAHHHQSQAASASPDGGHIRSFTGAARPMAASPSQRPAAARSAEHPAASSLSQSAAPAAGLTGRAGPQPASPSQRAEPPLAQSAVRTPAENPAAASTRQPQADPAGGPALSSAAQPESQPAPAPAAPATASRTEQQRPAGSRYQRAPASAAAAPALSQQPGPAMPRGQPELAPKLGQSYTGLSTLQSKDSAGTALKAGLDNLNSLLSTIPAIKQPRPAAAPPTSRAVFRAPGPVTESIEEVSGVL